jgi:hypothetical protein
MKLRSIIFILFFQSYIQPSGDLSTQITKLGLGRSFIEFTIDRDVQDIQLCASLKINSNESLHNFGHLETLQEQMHRFFLSQGNTYQQAEKAATILYEIVTSNLSDLQALTAWVCLRAFTPTSLYDVPRWHTDGYFYTSYQAVLHKIIYTFKGPHTLLIEVDHNTRSQFFDIQSQLFGGMNNLEIKNLSMSDLQSIRMCTRTNLAQLVQDFLPYQIRFGNGVVFLVGDNDMSAIHSEPAIHEHRLFMSIVPGTYEEIKSLDLRWNSLKTGK